MITRRRIRAAPLALVLAIPFAACGKKGPPLAPLRLVPEPVGAVTARRSGTAVQLDFAVPAKNQNGAGPVDLDRIEIYAVTLAPGTRIAQTRALVTRQNLVGTIAVKPPAESTKSEQKGEAGKAGPGDQPDTRPAPGERATFVEDLTADKLKPSTATEPPTSERSTAPPEAPSEMAARLYVIRAVSRGGRSAPEGRRVAVPLVPAPLLPGGVAVRTTERSYVLDWTAPVAEPGQPAIAFNVYVPDDRVPLNPAPLTTPAFEHGPVRPGESQCYFVRSVQVVQNVAIESEPSPPACAMWTDVYPPAAPKSLQAVAGDDGVSLSWDANTEEDLGGYVVLRGEAPGDTLQPLTREPIRETSYRDSTVTSGVRYVYAVIAIDRVTPPNASAQSSRQEVTAR